MLEKGLCSCKTRIISRSDGNMKVFPLPGDPNMPIFSEILEERYLRITVTKVYRNELLLHTLIFTDIARLCSIGSSSDILSLLLLRMATNIPWIYVLSVLFTSKLQSFLIFFLPGISEHNPTPGHLTGHRLSPLMAACGSWETMQSHQFFGLKF